MRAFLVVFAVLAVLAVPPAAAQDLVSTDCLGCICEASSGCNTTLGCQNGFCGPFRMPAAFFRESEISANPDFAQYSFKACSEDPFCAAAAIRKYMAKYSRDCDGDGLQTCKDFALVYQAGPNGCTNNQRVYQTEYWRRFENCLSFFHNA